MLVIGLRWSGWAVSVLLAVPFSWLMFLLKYKKLRFFLKFKIYREVMCENEYFCFFFFFIPAIYNAFLQPLFLLKTASICTFWGHLLSADSCKKTTSGVSVDIVKGKRKGWGNSGLQVRPKPDRYFPHSASLHVVSWCVCLRTEEDILALSNYLLFP